jgi:hypothetical protein
VIVPTQIGTSLVADGVNKHQDSKRGVTAGVRSDWNGRGKIRARELTRWEGRRVSRE